MKITGAMSYRHGEKSWLQWEALFFRAQLLYWASQFSVSVGTFPLPMRANADHYEPTCVLGAFGSSDAAWSDDGCQRFSQQSSH